MKKNLTQLSLLRFGYPPLCFRIYCCIPLAQKTLPEGTSALWNILEVICCLANDSLWFPNVLLGSFLIAKVDIQLLYKYKANASQNKQFYHSSIALKPRYLMLLRNQVCTTVDWLIMHDLI